VYFFYFYLHKKLLPYATPLIVIHATQVKYVAMQELVVWTPPPLLQVGLLPLDLVLSGVNRILLGTTIGCVLVREGIGGVPAVLISGRWFREAYIKLVAQLILRGLAAGPG
jgi:hypothetical protein